MPFDLPHPRADGATHLLLDPLELIEKLTLLIPPPRFHTLRFHGVLAPHAACRLAVIPARPEAEAEAPHFIVRHPEWTIEHVYLLLCRPLHLFLRHAEPARLDASVPAFIQELPPGSSPGTIVEPSPLDEQGRPRTDVSTPRT
jgi:hypothetical protein